MIKISLLALVLIVFFCTSQAQNTDYKKSAILAVNAEQMLNKAGFENLMNVIFNSKNNDLYLEENTKAKARKALAAIYGAGIDFDKKIWFVANAKESTQLSKKYDFNPFSNYDAAIYIPIANRQVMEKAIADINEGKESNWKEKDGFKYISENDFLVAMNDKVLAFHFNTSKMNTYGNYERYRIIVKTDTIKEKGYEEFKTIKSDSEQYEDAYGKEKADPNFVVDRVDAQGNVTRDEAFSKKSLLAKNKSYNYDEAIATVAMDTAVNYKKDKQKVVTAKKTTKNSKTPKKSAKTKKIYSDVVSAPDEEVKGSYGLAEIPPPPPPVVDFSDAKVEAVPAYVEEATTYKKATTAATATTTIYQNYAKKVKGKRDTITTYDYLGDNMRVKISYFECTPKERDSIDIVIENENKVIKDKFLEEKLIALKGAMPFDPTDNNDLKIIQESKSDMYLFAPGKAFDAMYNPYMFGVANLSTPSFGNSSFSSTLDFDAGKITLQSNTHYDAALLKFFSNFYYPLNNNWPANFGSKSKGQMQLNFNITKMLDYYKGFYSSGSGINIFKILENKGFKAEEISQAFTGETYGYLDTKISERTYKKEDGIEDILGGMAFGIKDIKVAVALLNKMASLSKEMPQFYAFDKTGKYLIFYGSMDDKSYAEDMANIIDSKSIDKEMISLSGNDFGKMQLNLKGLLKATIGKRDIESKSFNYFLERINMITFNMNRIEDGNYKTILAMDCGETKQNPLAMFIELFKVGHQEKEERREKYRLEREKEDQIRAEKRTKVTEKNKVKKPVRKTSRK